MKPKHWFVFILLGAIWSSSFLWIKIAVQEIGPITLVAFRVLFGLLFIIFVLLFQRPKLPRDFKSWWPVLFLGLINVAIPFFLISWGEQAIDSAVASILDATVPLFTIFIAHYALHDDKMTLQKILGLLVGFAGVVITMSKDIGSSPSSLLGQAAVVLACVFYAGSSVYARKTTEDAPVLLRSVGPLISSTIIMWGATFTLEAPLHIPQLPITWVALVWLGMLGSGFAFILSYYLIHEIGPTRATMVAYVLPLGGVILGITFLHEKATWQLLVGGLLIISSLVIANWQSSKATTDPERAQGVERR